MMMSFPIIILQSVFSLRIAATAPCRSSIAACRVRYAKNALHSATASAPYVEVTLSIHARTVPANAFVCAKLE